MDENHEQEKAAAEVPIPSKFDMFCEYSDLSCEEDDVLPLECFTTINSASGPSDSTHFEVLNPREIDALMTTTIYKYASIINLPYTTTRVLLSQFKWDSDKLIDKYFGCSDSTQFLKDAGIPDEIQTEGEGVSTSSGTQECEICCISKPSDEHEMYGMECGHIFCKTCWSQYITRNVNEGQMGQTIQCPAYNCSLFLDDSVVTEQLLTDYVMKDKYRHRVRNNFVETHNLLCWCPSPDCTFAIRVQSLNVQIPVKCICGYTLCFKCGNDWHVPAHCEHLKKWLIKCADDSETNKWIDVSTRNCTLCKTKIEKNGGFNHIVCTKCKAEFCWHCSLKYTQEHKCNKVELSPEYKAAEESREASRVQLQRYLFYFERHRNHMDSLKREKKLGHQIKEKMEAMLRFYGQRWVDVQFLTEAIDVLNQCRRVLMYCCVFAFYMENSSNESMIFEDNHGNLENACETLSGLLQHKVQQDKIMEIVGLEKLNEFRQLSPNLQKNCGDMVEFRQQVQELQRDCEDVVEFRQQMEDLQRHFEDVGPFRQQVQDLQRYCESRMKALLDHAKEGYEKGVWGLIL